MICAACSRPIPDSLLACALCVHAASTKALRQFQYAPLRTVIAGLGQLTTRRIEQQRHVQMFGAEQTYCGIPVSPQHYRSRVDYDPAELSRICSKCRSQLDELIEEARRTG
jgi:hypothetical protein